VNTNHYNHIMYAKTQVENHRGRKCVVIGASYGIGRRTADILASQGALVVYASGSRRKLVDCVEEEGKEYCSAVVMDTSDPESVRDGMADAICELGGAIDLVVYCPEHGDPDGFRSFEHEFDSGDWDSGWERYMNVHINGMMNSFRHTKDALLRSQRGGVFVGLSCVAESVGHPEPGRYGIFKAAVDMTLRQLSREYAPRGLRFFSIAPSGLPYTLATDRVGSPTQKLLKTMMRRSPPQDVGELIAFLTSEQDSFATGVPMAKRGKKRVRFSDHDTIGSYFFSTDINSGKTDTEELGIRDLIRQNCVQQ